MAKLPREILEIAERVIDFHRLSKLTDKSPTPVFDPQARPALHHLALTGPVVKLPSSLLDVPVSVSDILEIGLDAVPQSLHHPPQTLKTLASWLYTAVGARGRQAYPWGEDIGRNVQNRTGTFPVEIYVCAFAIEGLEPGLYHFNARSFTLQKMREGTEALQLLRRGRPDLQVSRNSAVRDIDFNCLLSIQLGLGKARISTSIGGVRAICRKPPRNSHGTWHEHGRTLAIDR